MPLRQWMVRHHRMHQSLSGSTYYSRRQDRTPAPPPARVTDRDTAVQLKLNGFNALRSIRLYRG
eukprot:7072542-Prymnesium_polylepis.1